jgi:tRNA threonylcarbamoyl adenosine modification protein YjeE
MRRIIPDPDAMHALGQELAGLLRAGDLMVLTGPLGAGKTTFTRGLGEGLRVRGPVTSPTFVLARTHPSTVGGPPLVHVDAYRLASAMELDDLDIDFARSIVVVEWGRRSPVRSGRRRGVRPAGTAHRHRDRARTALAGRLRPDPAPGPGRSGDRMSSGVAAGRRYWVALAGIGLVGGLLSGIFGVGGGIVMVPLLIALAGMDQRRAATTSLAAIVPTSIAGSLGYLAAGHIDLVAGAIIAAGAVVGSVIGAKLLRRIPLFWLRWMFITLLLVVALRMVLVEPERGETLDLDALVVLGYLALGLVMGIASGLFGIGGGVIAVPALVAVFGVSDLIAKGTSLLVLVPTSIVGTLTNLRAHAVDLRAGLVVGVAATIAAIPGVALAVLIPPRLSSILFAALLLIAVAQLTVTAVRAHRR